MFRLIRYRCLAAIGLGTFLAAPVAQAAYTYTDLYTLVSPSGDILVNPLGASSGKTVGFGVLNHALLWSPPSGSVVDLDPTGLSYSAAFGVGGNQQVGIGGHGLFGSSDHALLWTGTAASAIDLNPAGSLGSRAFATNGTQQVGYANVTGPAEAMLWSGTSASAVDLNPPGFAESEALAISGMQQAGFGSGSATGSHNHALLWTGTAASAVDLNPVGFSDSQANGLSGTQQVGWGYGAATGGALKEHALLWTGTAASTVDLNPAGFRSFANATNGIQQVGYGYDASNLQHALLWSGSAASVVDLAAVLPSKFGTSQAESIDASGNVFGWASDSNGVYHAIEWSPTQEVPEPGALGALGLRLAPLLCRRRRRLCH